MMLAQMHVSKNTKTIRIAKTTIIRLIIAKIGLMHIGIFILLLLSSERNFGVRLNKPYITRIPMNLPIFTGTHADLLIIVRKQRLCFD